MTLHAQEPISTSPKDEPVPSCSNVDPDFPELTVPHTISQSGFNDLEALVAATREIGLEVSADKTKYMVVSRDQNAGRNHSVRNDNNTFERVEEFKYLGTTLTNQNSIQEEIKSRLRSGNACYH